MPFSRAWLAVASLLLMGCAPVMEPETLSTPPAKPKIPASAERLTVAGGCFWCLEALYEDLEGVYEVESAYVGGPVKNPTYEEVCSGNTGHAEAVTIFYDPKKLEKADLLRLFFVTHDPTTLNRQGPDVGTQYRSAMFYLNEEEKALMTKIRDEVSAKKVYANPIVTTLEPMLNYTVAEEYHQDYYEKFEKATPAQRMRMNAGYCNAVVAPKVTKFRKEFADRLKRRDG